MQLLCSTGAFSRFPDITDYQSILRYGPELGAGGVDGLEVMYFPDWTPYIERIAEQLRASGLRFPAVHAEKGIGPALISEQAEERERGWQWLEAGCRLGQVLASRMLVFHLWGYPEFDEKLERNLAVLGDCVSMAAQYGLELSLETVPCTSADPLRNVRQAIKQDDRCLVTLDTEFLALHAQVEAALQADWLWQEHRVRHIHIKDYDGMIYAADNSRRYLHPGEGTVDFTHFFAALKERGFDGYISLESSVVGTDGTRDIDKLQRSLERLRQYIL